MRNDFGMWIFQKLKRWFFAQGLLERIGSVLKDQSGGKCWSGYPRSKHIPTDAAGKLNRILGGTHYKQRLSRQSHRLWTYCPGQSLFVSGIWSNKELNWTETSQLRLRDRRRLHNKDLRQQKYAASRNYFGRAGSRDFARLHSSNSVRANQRQN